MKIQIARLFLSFCLLFSFSSCSEYQRRLPKDGWNGSTHQRLENTQEIFQQKMYDAGPAGWMIEWEYDAYETSVLLFCSEGIFQQTIQNAKYDGTWFLDQDSIRVQIQKVTKDIGIGKPIPWEGEMSHKTFFQYKNYKEEIQLVDTKKTFSWYAITESVFGENDTPFKVVSIYSDCNAQHTSTDSLTLLPE